ncbi:hypothetical protein ACJX0J_011949, partial [Zea mays]
EFGDVYREKREQKDIPRREKRRAYDLPLKICLERFKNIEAKKNHILLHYIDVAGAFLQQDVYIKDSTGIFILFLFVYYLTLSFYLSHPYLIFKLYIPLIIDLLFELLFLLMY